MMPQLKIIIYPGFHLNLNPIKTKGIPSAME